LKTAICFSPHPTKSKAVMCGRVSLPYTMSQINFSIHAKSGSFSFSIADNICPYWTIFRQIETWNGFLFNFTETHLALIQTSEEKPKLTSELCDFPPEPLT
jgi:hypothetical protein